MTKKKLLTLVIVIFLTSVLVLIAMCLFRNKSKVDTPAYHQASAIEKRFDQAATNNLKHKDYISYQYRLYNNAAYYITAKDFKKASSILDEVHNNVPARALSSDIYIYRADIAYKQGNKEQYEKYTQDLIAALNQQGRRSEAQYYIDQLQQRGF